MVDQKVSSLTEELTLALTDFVYLVKDAGGGIFVSAKTSISTLFDFIWGRSQASPETSTTLTPSTGQVSLDFTTKVNIVTLTESTEVQLPNMASWAAGDTMRLDLYVQQNGTGGYELTWATGWKANTATLPTNTTDPNAIDRFVIDCVKDLGICAVGLAQSDLS